MSTPASSEEEAAGPDRRSGGRASAPSWRWARGTRPPGRCCAVSTAATHDVTVTLAPGETVTLRVGAGDAITARHRRPSLRRHDLDRPITVDRVRHRTPADETVTIDETAGRFEPGFTTGEPGLNEIEFCRSTSAMTSRRPLRRRQRHADRQRYPGRRVRCRSARRAPARVCDDDHRPALPAAPRRCDPGVSRRLPRSGRTWST